MWLEPDILDKHGVNEMASNTSKNTQGKFVAARIMRGGKTTQKNFSLKAFGTWADAQRAATDWVQETKKTLPEKQTTQGKLTRRNNSGVVGVNIARKVRTKGANVHEHWSWVARWPGCPFKGGVSWGIDKYGDDAAFILAVLSRRMESVDREAILAEYTSLKNTDQAERILDQKLLELV